MAAQRGRAFVWMERALLGIGMSAAGFVIERRLIKAIKKGGVQAAPRTAERTPGPATPETASPHGELSRSV